MKEKIIRNIKMLPKTCYGDYKTEESVRVAIAKAMNYEVRLMIGGKYEIVNYEDFKKAQEILNNMINEGTLIKNKKGGLVKLKK